MLSTDFVDNIEDYPELKKATKPLFIKAFSGF